jgi:hypothetical protein
MYALRQRWLKFSDQCADRIRLALEARTASVRQGLIDGFKPANLSKAACVRILTRDPMDTDSFFFSFESDLPETAVRLYLAGLRSGRPRLRRKALAAPVFIVQNESCLP